MSLNTIMTNFRYNITSFFCLRLFLVTEEVVGIGAARVRIGRAFEELLNVGLGSKSTHDIDHLKKQTNILSQTEFQLQKILKLKPSCHLTFIIGFSTLRYTLKPTAMH